MLLGTRILLLAASMAKSGVMQVAHGVHWVDYILWCNSTWEYGQFSTSEMYSTLCFNIMLQSYLGQVHYPDQSMIQCKTNTNSIANLVILI